MQNSTPVGLINACYLPLKACTETAGKKQRENERKKGILEGKWRKHSKNTSLEIPALDFRNFLEVGTPTAA